ncbi:hypothetical protein YC2023_012792 [Brassica napus]
MTDVGVLASQGKAPVSPGVEMVFSVGLGGNKGSWVGAVLGQKILKKYDVEVTMKDGVGSVIVPDEITKDVAPLCMFSWQGLSFVASPVGSPVRLHPETAQCLNLDVAKIFVKADLTKELPAKMNFNIQGQDILVEYSYPRLPSKCLKCGKWGHKTCPITREEQIDLPEVQVEKESVRVEASRGGGEKENATIVESHDLKQVVEVMQIGNLDEKNKIMEKEIVVEQIEEEEEREEEEEGEITEPVKDFELQTDDSLKSPVGAVGKVKEGVIQRQSLPRDSKMKHKFLGDTSVQKAQEVGPSELNKKKSCRHQ